MVSPVLCPPGHRPLYSHMLTDCRPSQLANQGFSALADKLTESLRESGDLGLAAPNLAMSVFSFLFLAELAIASSCSTDDGP